MDIRIDENEVHMRKLWSFEVEMKVGCYLEKVNKIKFNGQLLTTTTWKYIGYDVEMSES